MDVTSILGISVALAMDAFAVSIAVGVKLGHIHPRQYFRLSWHFGLFQGLMPIVGWSLGITVRGIIEAYDHWLAFILLAYVGGNMLKEAFFPSEKKDDLLKDPTKGLTMVILSVATSIDALAIGFSLSVLNLSILYPAAIIAIVASLFTIIGMQLGRKVGSSGKLKSYAEILGGLILLIIGFNILYEHGVFA